MFVKKVRSIETEHYFKWIIEANFYDFMTEKKKKKPIGINLIPAPVSQ